MNGSCNHYERKDAPSTAKLSRVVTTERAFFFKEFLAGARCMLRAICHASRFFCCEGSNLRCASKAGSPEL